MYIVGYVKDMDQGLLDMRWPKDDEGNLNYDPDDTEFEKFIGIDVHCGGRNSDFYTKDENGNLVKKRRLDGFRYYIDEETGAYDIWLERDHCDTYEADGSFLYPASKNILEEIYLYASYDDERVTDEANEAMERIFEGAGCNLMGKNWDYGEMPPYSGK